MGPVELLNDKARWLWELTGQECPWPIATDHDLREWALNLVWDSTVESELTGGDLRRVWDLIEELSPPQERSRKARQAKRQPRKDKLSDEDYIEEVVKWYEHLFVNRENIANFQMSGSAARKVIGERTSLAIVKLYDSYTLPKRERAGCIANRLNKSPQYVRRVLRKEGRK